MAIQKNFVVKNGIEVNDNLIFADKDRNTVGIGTTITPEKLQVNGGIGATSLVVTGVGTIPTLKSTEAFVSNGYINVGLVTSISGAGLTYTTGNFGIVNANNVNAISGVVTNLSGTISTYTNSYSTVLNSGTVLTPNLYAVSGIVTNGTVTNLTGTAATIGTVQIVAGIVTATSGVVTYYGDGRYLNLTSNAIKGIGIGTTGGVVGYGITFLDLKGAGVSTSIYNSSVGIATIFFQGGGGGGGGAIGIGSTFPGTPLSIELPPSNGDLFFHIDYGRTFIYYDEVILGVGSSAFWIDAAPFNVGINPSLAGVAFSMGSASNPSAYFEGYPTTGWFSPTPGQLGVVSVGNTILTVNPNGIVVTGIVTVTGIAGTFSGTSAVFSGNSSDNIVRITQEGTGNALIVEDSTHTDVTPFVITGIGSVGIGTNAPINTLDVHGTVRLARQDAVSSGGEIVFARASDNTNAWAVDVEGSDFRVTDSSQSSTRIHIGSRGNVGLGSTATSRLHVFGDAIVTGILTAANVTGGSVVVGSGGLSVSGVTTVAAGSTSAPSITPTGDPNTGVFFPAADTVSLGEGGVEVIRINSSSNVGISTLNPTEKLHVIGNILASGNVTGYSDETLKDNIQTIPDALDKVTQLRGVEYDRNDIEGNPRHIGVIAQEVEKIIPEVVTTHEDGIKSVAYGNLVGLLIEAIKDLKEEVNELKVRLEEI